MFEFYIIAGGVAVVATFLLVRPLILDRGDAMGRDEADAQIFQDQLAEIDRDLERGTISAAEAHGARTEVSRRLLAAAARAETTDALTPAPQGHSGLVAGLTLVGIPAIAAALYLGIGAPGSPDRPLADRRAAMDSTSSAERAADRPSQAEAEARAAASLPPAPDAARDEEFMAQLTRLQEVVSNRPDDIEGHRLLANSLMQAARWREAWETYARLIALIGDGAEGTLYATQAEAMVLAAGGYVSPEAEAAVRSALERDPSLPIARYYAGLTLRQEGRLDDAIQIWGDLRRDSPADAPYLEWLDMMLSDTITARNSMATGPGPTQSEIQSAQQMTPEERAEMIRGMVQRLDERLSAQGGSAEEWARLIASYATLKDEAAARDALSRALEAFPTGLMADALLAHAAQLGLIEGDTTAPGPSAADIQAAQQMSAEDRAAMVQGMVSQLEDRLTSDGGSAEEWLRLITSYVRLDQRDDALRVYKLAEVALAADPAAGFVKEQTLLLGIPIE